MKCHEIKQTITDSVVAHMQVYETGAVFNSRLRHYLNYLAEEADLMVYLVSVDIETDALSRPVGDFLNGLKSTVTMAR